MGTPRRVAMFNLNITHRDPRVLRTASALAALGHNVVVFEMRHPNLAERDMVRGIEIRRIQMPESYTDADMAQIGRVSPEAADVIRKANPSVYATGTSAAPRTLSFADRLLAGIGRGIRAPIPPRPPTKDEWSEVLAIRSIMQVNLAIFRAAQEYAPEIAHCNDLDTLLIGYMLKKTTRSVLIYDAHEIYPEQFADDMRSEIWNSFYTELERQLIRSADAKMTVCESLGRYFANVYDATGFATIRNLPSVAQLTSQEVLERRRECPKILYHGAYVPHRGLEQVMEAARNVKDATFVFRGIGSYGENLKRVAAELEVEDRVSFVDPVGVDELVPTASECDIGLNPFVPVCKNTEFALPNKFFEYLMAGLACVGSDLIEIRRHTEDHRVGRLFPSLEPHAIAQTLNGLISRPDELVEYRRNALRAARDELNWEQEVQKFYAFYQPILNG